MMIRPTLRRVCSGWFTCWFELDDSLTSVVFLELVLYSRCSTHTQPRRGGHSVVLHALTVDKDAELVVDSPDTDVLILLIEMYQRLPAATSFLTGRRNLRRNIAVEPICEKLGQKRTSAMIGFHAFKGSDMSGRFAGRSKDWCFKVCLKCDSKILDALGALG